MRSLMTLLVSLGLSILLAACGGDSASKPTVPFAATAPGYTLSVWVVAPLSTMKPDSIVQSGNTIFIGYQNSGDVKDGSVPGLTNSVLQYDLNANLLKTYTVPGHVDGLLNRSDTNELWCMANEDGNPELTIINLGNGTQITYQPTVNPTAHGGGFDDLQLINGVVYVTASNPTITPGVQPTAPTVVSLTLNPNGTTFDVAPVLAGDATAIDITPSIGGSPNQNFNMPVTLALTDPDSEATDPIGTTLVVDSQADGKLVFIKNPGPAQTVSVLSLTLFNDKDGPTVPVDDTRFAPQPGPHGSYMLFTDAANTTYRLDATFVPGTAYSDGQGQVMQLDLTTGHLTPVATSLGAAAALQDPHGMLFVPF